MEPETRHGSEPGFEVKDAPVRTIIRYGIALTVITILVCLAMVGLFRLFVSMQNPGERNPMAPLRQTPPEPRVEAQPWQQLRTLHVREDQILSSYGWVDKQKGTVRIPIDRAMDLTIERGLPVRKEAQRK